MTLLRRLIAWLTRRDDRSATDKLVAMGWTYEDRLDRSTNPPRTIREWHSPNEPLPRIWGDEPRNRRYDA